LYARKINLIIAFGCHITRNVIVIKSHSIVKAEKARDGTIRGREERV
jgi:hypothetical protein